LRSPSFGRMNREPIRERSIGGGAAVPRKAAGLTATKVRTAKPGRYGDGGGLYLLVRSPKARFWVFRYTLAGTGRLRDMGLGAASGASSVSLAGARDKAAELLG
jgi:hypothetical protein